MAQWRRRREKGKGPEDLLLRRLGRILVALLIVLVGVILLMNRYPELRIKGCFMTTRTGSVCL
jgi:hypothetical protein